MCQCLIILSDRMERRISTLHRESEILCRSAPQNDRLEGLSLHAIAPGLVTEAVTISDVLPQTSAHFEEDSSGAQAPYSDRN